MVEGRGVGRPRAAAGEGEEPWRPEPEVSSRGPWPPPIAASAVALSLEGVGRRRPTGFYPGGQWYRAEEKPV